MGSLYGPRELAIPSSKSNRSYTLTLSIFGLDRGEYFNVLQKFLNLLEKKEIDYCVIGGLAVNAYVDPVVSLDLDIVVAADAIEELIKETEKIFTIKKFSHSLNLSSSKSDLRIQLQTDSRSTVYTTLN